MSKLDPVYLILAVIASFGLGVIVTDKPPEIVTQVEPVEVPVIVTQTETRVEVVEVEKQVILTQYNTTIHEVLVPTPIPLRDFPDKVTLLTFIWNDDTDTLDYQDRWTCMDYTVRLVKNAERLGYRVIFVFREDSSHAVAMAYCEAEAQYIAWEPQSDAMLWTWTSTNAG